jgi:hypothetical protein
MKALLKKLGLLIPTGAAALISLRNRLAEPRSNGTEAQLDALEKAMEIQSTLNENVDVQIKVIHALLEKTQKKLRIVIVLLIATATVAALAFATALMR